MCAFWLFWLWPRWSKHLYSPCRQLFQSIKKCVFPLSFLFPDYLHVFRNGSVYSGHIRKYGKEHANPDYSILEHSALIQNGFFSILKLSWFLHGNILTQCAPSKRSVAELTRINVRNSVCGSVQKRNGMSWTAPFSNVLYLKTCSHHVLVKSKSDVLSVTGLSISYNRIVCRISMCLILGEVSKAKYRFLWFDISLPRLRKHADAR